jgi:hypothetical protein
VTDQPSRKLNGERSDNPDEVEVEVLRAIRSVRFGSVEITIHDARVVQIERKEKKRFGS